jgi:hypothetical protein
MSTTHDLKGLRGENPAGFLAALGLLRTLDRIEPALRPRLHWHWEGGWMPVLALNQSLSRDELVRVLYDQLKLSEPLSVYKLEPNLNLPAGVPRAFVKDTRGSMIAEEERALFTGFALDTGHPEHPCLRSPLVNLNGGGRQDFLPTCKKLIGSVTWEELDHALFEPWAYTDAGSGRILHWDPDNERQHALQWEKPGSDNNRTVAGADRLGIEALPLFPAVPTLPSRGVPVTMSYRHPRFLSAPCFFTQGPRRDSRVYFFWPLWGTSLTCSVVRSLLWSMDGEGILNGKASAGLQARGISVVFASERIMGRAGASLSPSQPWWIAAA